MGGAAIPLDDLIAAYTGTFKGIYPVIADAGGKADAKIKDYYGGSLITRKSTIARPTVFMPIFPGTNCEIDTARAFKRAGADVDIFIVKNRTAADVNESVRAAAERVNKANILMLPGGFSGGDEPDGSGKFICAMLQNPFIADAINNLLFVRGGLALGICNGFQALIKLGLLPYGRIEPLKSDSPTLTVNTINRHAATIARIRIASNLSPWLNAVKPGMVFNQAISHGEGRFVAGEKHLKAMIAAGQIATQYAGADGLATMESPFNPNGSALAVEGITSPDGRILGKMGHSERIGDNICKNIDDTPFDIRLFESGVMYFR
jgi:phosphoribosylformylglycinamidine synthase